MGDMGNRNKSQYPGFLLHTSPLSGCIQNFKTVALIAGEKSVMDFYEKERKKDK